MSACLSCARSAPRKAPVARAALLLLCLCVLATCGFRRSRILAEQGVKEFHDLMDREQYEAIYNASDDSLKKAMSLSDFVAYLRDIHSRLGDARTFTVNGFSVNSSPGQGAQVALAMETEFDRGTAQERFLWRVAGGRALLLDYRAEVERSTGPRTVREYPFDQYVVRGYPFDQYVVREYPFDQYVVQIPSRAGWTAV